MLAITDSQKDSQQQEEGVAAAEEGVPSAADKPTAEGSDTKAPEESTEEKGGLREQGTESPDCLEN